MTITHSIARSFIAPIFVAGGMDALKNPDEKAKKADQIIGRLASTLGLPDDPVKLVRINGGVQLAAGVMLAIGWVPRLSAGVLAASLVPTTLAGHRYWDEVDPTKRQQQKVQLMKNLAMFGGLVFAATDTNGAPSLRWRTRRAAGHAQKAAIEARARAAGSIGDAIHSVSAHLPDRPSSHSLANTVGDRAVEAASTAGEAISGLGIHAAHAAHRAATKAAEQSARMVDAGAEGLPKAVANVAATLGRLGQNVNSQAHHVGAHARTAITHALESAEDMADKATSLVS